MFCQKQASKQTKNLKNQKTPLQLKSPHFCLKNENSHTRFSSSPKSNRKVKEKKKKDVVTTLPQDFFLIYTLVMHIECMTTNQAINITLQLMQNMA